MTRRFSGSPPSVRVALSELGREARRGCTRKTVKRQTSVEGRKGRKECRYGEPEAGQARPWLLEGKRVAVMRRGLRCTWSTRGVVENRGNEM
jgi:hypothetical protein